MLCRRSRAFHAIAPCLVAQMGFRDLGAELKAGVHVAGLSNHVFLVLVKGGIAISHYNGGSEARLVALSHFQIALLVILGVFGRLIGTQHTEGKLKVTLGGRYCFYDLFIPCIYVHMRKASILYAKPNTLYKTKASRFLPPFLTSM
jgi:hypothetical protein